MVAEWSVTTSMKPYCPFRLMFLSSPKPWIEDMRWDHNQMKVNLCKELKIDLEQSLDVTLPAVMAKVAEEQPVNKWR